PDKIHILNVCFTVNGMVEKFGGTAGNIAYSLSLLGEKAHILVRSGRIMSGTSNGSANTAYLSKGSGSSPRSSPPAHISQQTARTTR
ncbi:MAG TPA: hypothetical protein VN260_07425, partial [Dissulfurispiraceae bacterium]|nr:hypothetical protein [Dissulfurispiraceae bacterium]